MTYPLEPSRRERRVLAVLATMQLWPGSRATSCTTSEVVENLPGNPSRARVVSSLRALVEAGYAYETTHYVKSVSLVDIAMENETAKNGRINAWNITPTGLAVSLGVLA